MNTGIDEQLMRATLFAAQKHQNQRRKDRRRTPYINHPLTVMAILRLEAGIEDSATLQAAILHDTVEDTDTTLPEIQNLFGQEVASLVDELSDDKNLPARERKSLQIEHAAGRSVKASLVKYADKIANLRDILSNPPVGWSLQRKRDYFDWAKAVVDKLSHGNETLQRLFDEIFQKKP